MPIYEYECPIGHKFNILCPVSEMKEKVDCPLPGKDLTSNLDTWHIAYLVPSLVSMHPDTFWSGKTTEQGYVTSKRQHQQILKEKGLERIERGMKEQVKKVAKNRVQDTLEKNAKKTEAWLANELKNA